MGINKNESFQLLRYKDIMILLGCSYATAQRVMLDIKKEFKCKRVTKKHLEKYLFGEL